MKPRMIYDSKVITDLLQYKTLSEVIVSLTDLSKEWPDATIGVSSYQDYGDTYGEVTAERQRLQTEEEVQEDLKRERKAKEYKRQQYEALKKEFESGI